jgi:hypothetical protein
MAWVAAYAGWSSVIGLVVAAVTGDTAREVSPGASAGLTVLGPLVPTLVALWFNDWARDGFPTREQRRAAAAPAPPAPPAPPATGEDRSVKITTLDRGVGASQLEGEPAPEAPGFPVAPLLRDRLDLDRG